MPSSPADYHAFLGQTFGQSNADDRFRDRMRRLDSIVDDLRASPLAPWARIFGSSVGSPDAVPGDIDAFIDLAEAALPRDVLKQAVHGLLELAVKGGYHGNYGAFDPFVLSRRGTLYCRNEGVRQMDVGWSRAGHADGLVAAGRSGVPLANFDRRFITEFPLPSAGQPDMRP